MPSTVNKPAKCIEYSHTGLCKFEEGMRRLNTALEETYHSLHNSTSPRIFTYTISCEYFVARHIHRVAAIAGIEFKESRHSSSTGGKLHEIN